MCSSVPGGIHSFEGCLAPPPGADPGRLAPPPGADPGRLAPPPGADPARLGPPPGADPGRERVDLARLDLGLSNNFFLVFPLDFLLVFFFVGDLGGGIGKSGDKSTTSGGCGISI